MKDSIIVLILLVALSVFIFVYKTTYIAKTGVENTITEGYIREITPDMVASVLLSLPEEKQDEFKEEFYKK